MKRIQLAAIMLLCAAQVVCQSKITNYQKKIKKVIPVTSTEQADRFVNITMTSNDRPVTLASLKQKERKSVFELSDRGQQAFISSLHRGTGEDVSAFMANLRADLGPEKKTSAYIVDRTSFVKKIELNVRDLFAASSNAGRIAELIITVRLPDNKDIEFQGFRNIATKYDMVELGSVSMTRNRDFSVSAGYSAPATGGPGASATGSFGRSVTEEVGMGIRRIALKGTVNSMEATIYQEGYQGINLNDLVSLELIFKATNIISDPQLMIGGLFNKEGKAVTDSSKINIDRYYLTIPATSPALDVNLGYEFVYREIINKKGRNSPGEWDDKINLHLLKKKSVVEQSFPFLRKDDLDPGTWVIENKDALESYLYLDYFDGPVQLKFTSLEAAKKFEDWLMRTKSVSVKGFRLKTGTSLHNLVPLQQGHIKSLRTLKVRN